MSLGVVRMMRMMGMVGMVGMRLSAVIFRLGDEHHGDIGNSRNNLDDAIGAHTKTPPFIKKVMNRSNKNYFLPSSLSRAKSIRRVEIAVVRINIVLMSYHLLFTLSFYHIVKTTSEKICGKSPVCKSNFYFASHTGLYFFLSKEPSHHTPRRGCSAT